MRILHFDEHDNVLPYIENGVFLVNIIETSLAPLLHYLPYVSASMSGPWSAEILYKWLAGYSSF